MTSTLIELYHGNIIPAEREFIRNGEYHKAVKQLTNNEEKLNKLLDDESKKYFNEFCRAQSKILCEETLSSFTCGFRLGAKIIIDVFSKDDNNLQNIV